MNQREAFQALLDGKKIRRPHWGSDEFLVFQGDRLVNERGFTGFGCLHSYYELYHEPNPHAVGTFAWAREEARRNPEVRMRRRDDWDRNRYLHPFGRCMSFKLSDLDATNWEIVP